MIDGAREVARRPVRMARGGPCERPCLIDGVRRSAAARVACRHRNGARALLESRRRRAFRLHQSGQRRDHGLRERGRDRGGQRGRTRAQRGQAQWAVSTGAERARVLRRAAHLLRSRNQALAELETRDTGKPIQETLVVDVVSGADCLEYFASLAQSLAGEHVDLGPQAFGYPARRAWASSPASARGITRCRSLAGRLRPRRWPAAMP